MKVSTEFYTLTPYAGLLHVESFLSWDEKVSEQFMKDAMGLVLQYYTENDWAVLHDMRNWQLGTPEFERILSGLLHREVTHTHTHHALVVGTSRIKTWQVEKIFKDIARYKIRLFRHYKDAEKWLASQGFDKSVPLF